MLSLNHVLLICLAMALGVAELFLHIYEPVILASGIPSIAMVLVGIWLPDRRHVFALAAVATLLDISADVLYAHERSAFEFGYHGFLAVSIWVSAFLIASRKKAEQELAANLDARTRLYENSPLGAIRWDKNFNCVEWNVVAEKIFGFNQEEAIGRNALDLIVPPEVHDKVSDIFQSLLTQRGGTHSINENITKDGRTVTCEWFNMRQEGTAGTPSGVFSLVQDITHIREESKARALTEDQLRESEETFHSFYQIVPDVFMITSLTSGNIVDVNDGFTQITGFSRDETIGRHTTALNLWEKDSDRERLVTGLINDGVVNNLSATFRGKDGYLWPGIMSARVIQLRGEPHILSSTKDVTEILRSQQEAIEASRAKSEFLSSMSHELRTPLNIILGFGQLLRTDTEWEVPESHARGLDHILRGGNHLLKLIDEVLDLSKIETGNMNIELTSVPISDMLDQCTSQIDPIAKRNNITISIAADELTGLSVQADQMRFKQVLLNLLSNAIKYNRDGGKVIIRGSVSDGETVCVDIQDTGIGIADTDRESIFQPFSRIGTKVSEVEGTGIGLTITKKLVDLMGGDIDFTSTENVGSTFSIKMPLADSSLVNSATSSHRSPMEFSQLGRPPINVLCIEDIPANIRLVEGILERYGDTRLSVAHTAELGISIAENQPLDIILMDVNLPGMNGVEATIRLKNNPATRDIPIVIISASAMDVEIRRGIEAGADGYLTKPFDVDKFLAVMNKTVVRV